MSAPGPSRTLAALIALCLLLVGAIGCMEDDPTAAALDADDPARSDGGLPGDGSKGKDTGTIWATTPCNGYTIYSTPSPTSVKNPRIFLLDMKGKVVHEWGIMGYPAVMMPGGYVMGSKRMREGDLMLYGDTIELVKYDWGGRQQWSYSNWDTDGTKTVMSRQHHDYVFEGNPVGYYAPGQSFVQGGKRLILGHKTHTVPKVSHLQIMDDVIYEVDRDGRQTGFSWYASDHIDEMGFDQAARNDIKQTPNWDNERYAGDWIHLNSMAVLGRNRWYEVYNDQRFHPANIIISSREGSFIAIISRQTGKIVWRLGPDYSKPPASAIEPLVGQHHAHMIPWGLPGGGNILVFDNGGVAGYGGTNGGYKFFRLYSRVVEIDPVAMKIVWQYGSKAGVDSFFSPFVSSAQRLPNGNTLVTAGEDGLIFELTREKKVVWKYQSTFKSDGFNFYVYRAYRVPPEWLPTGINPGGYQPWNTLYPIATY